MRKRRPEPLHVLSIYASELHTGKWGAISRTHRELEHQGYTVSDEWVRRVTSGNYRQSSAELTPTRDANLTYPPVMHQEPDVIPKLPTVVVMSRASSLPNSRTCEATLIYWVTVVITISIVLAGMKAPLLLLLQLPPLLGLWWTVGEWQRWYRVMKPGTSGERKEEYDR
jgi:hypothetical protein